MSLQKKPLWQEIFSKKMLLIFWLGFSSGLPFMLTGSTLKIWLAREQIDLSTIGYLTWVSMAYSLKFLWAPLVDRFTLFKLGRRRSWMFLTQAGLAGSIACIGLFDPKVSLMAIVLMCIVTAFLSATQDIAFDAYRREYLNTEELGFGSSMTMYGYRIAMLVSGGLGVGLVGVKDWQMDWNHLYFLMGALMCVGLVATFFAPEPKIDGVPPRTMAAAVIEPVREFLKRKGAWTILAFIFLYKFGDAVGLAMLNPYYVHIGYSNEDIALIAKTFGLASSLVGLFLGSTLMYYIGIYRSLWIFGVMQAIAIAIFAMLEHTGPQVWALATTVIFEDVSTAMASAVFVAFIAAITNKQYTATQYAILSSIATLGRNFFSGFAGDMIKALGWDGYFYTCTALAIPGMLMLFYMRRYYQPQGDEAKV
jgi:PAT family beta-lactamase induction signal transducer AmpG